MTENFIFGFFPNRAGVEQDDVGVLRVSGEFVPIEDEISHHDFGVDEILGAAETNKTYFQSSFQFSSSGLGRG